MLKNNRYQLMSRIFKDNLKMETQIKRVKATYKHVGTFLATQNTLALHLSKLLHPCGDSAKLDKNVTHFRLLLST